MTLADSTAVAVELERLRGDLGRDLGEIKTACAVLVERSNRVEQDVRELRAGVDADLAGMRAELEDLKRARWRSQGALLGAAAVLGGGAGWLAQALGS